jgi:hypothetical protein
MKSWPTDPVYKKYMRLVVLIGLLFGIVAGSIVHAQDVSPPGVVRYLGLAVPYPENPPESPKTRKIFSVLYPAAVRVWLTVDSSGATRKVASPADSAVYIDPVKADLDSLRFSFTPGKNLSAPLSIPVNVDYSDRTRDGWRVRISFPISADLTTDSVLLREFFAANGIEPPRIAALTPIDYSLRAEPDKLRYWTVTAQVSLDDKGNLQDITYPVAGQDRMRHQIQMALMRAEYTPARLKRTPFATDFLVTFRIFDNIKYPFSPLDRSDTTETPVASRYVMTYYYNENDIFLYPIPRRPAGEYLQSPKLGNGKTGFSDVTVDIDSEGTVTAVYVSQTWEQVRQVAAKAARLLHWYPAVDTRGRPTAFTGKIRFEFVGTSKIVYIPEWLPR